MTENGISVISGAVAVDDRGSLRFVNDFNPEVAGVKRFYVVENHRKGFVRAWHGHKNEGKFVYCVKGAALLGAVKVMDWRVAECWFHLQTAKPEKFVLSSEKPSVLYIPPGYANGFMSLTDDCILQFFSTSTLEESKGDDYRFPARLWDIWSVEER